MPKSLAPLVALILLLLPTAPARAAAGDATAALQAGQARIDAILEREGTPSKEDLRAAVNTFIDFEELARRALGRHWVQLDESQQQDFQSTMRSLVEAAYLSKVSDRADYEVVYLGEEAAGDEEVLVHTRLQASSDRIPMDYRLYRNDGRWLVYDVITDGLSLLENYRSQFNRLIAKRGFDGLMQTLERKLAELERADTAAADPT